MIGGSKRRSNWRPVGAPQMRDIDNPQISEAMMVWTEGEQVLKMVGATLGTGCDVMNIGRQVKPADNTAVSIAQARLLLVIAPFATTPIAVVDARKERSLMLTLTEAIAEIVLMHLRWVKTDLASAVGAQHGGTILPTCRRGEALPFTVAGIRSTGDALCQGGWMSGDSCSTHRTRLRFLTATIIAVMLSTVLMVLDIARLLAGIVCFGNDAATAARTDNRGFITSIGALSCHGLPLPNAFVKNSIPHNNSYGKSTIALPARGTAHGASRGAALQLACGWA